MSLEIIQGFKVSKAEPVDTKLRLSKEEMLNIDENTMPAQYFCVCSDDGKMYTYDVNNSIDPETGKFRIVGEDLEAFKQQTVTNKALIDALNNSYSELRETNDEMQEAIEWLIANGGGGENVVPTITSTFTDCSIEKNIDLNIPIFFRSHNMGDGTAYIIINNIESDTVGVDQGNNIVKVKSELLAGKTENTVGIYVKDSADIISNQLTWNVVVGGIELSSTFDYEVDYDITDDIRLTYNIETGINEEIKLYLNINGVETEHVSQNGDNFIDLKASDLGLGTHPVTMYAKVDKFVSRELRFNIVVGSNTSVVVLDIPSDNYEVTVTMRVNFGDYSVLFSEPPLIEWGDNSSSVGDYVLEEGNPTKDFSHTYAQAGKYVVKLKNGTFDYSNHNSFKENIYKIVSLHDKFPIINNYFRESSKLVEANISNAVIYDEYAMVGCSSLTKVIANNVKAIDIAYCFYGCSNLTEIIGLDTWNTDELTDMQYVFGNTPLTSLDDIAGWNTKNVINIRGAFETLKNITNLDFISNWNLNKVTNMSYMFTNCSGLTSRPINIIPDSVENINGLYYGCPTAILEDISGMVFGSGITEAADWIDKTVVKYANDVTIKNEVIKFKDFTSLVECNDLVIGEELTDISGMFENCTSLTHDIVIPSHITNASNCFKDCTSMTHIHSNWNNSYSSNITATGCYSGCTGITHFDNSELVLDEYSTCLDKIPEDWGGYGFEESNTSVVVLDIPSDNYEVSITMRVNFGNNAVFFSRPPLITWGDNSLSVGDYVLEGGGGLESTTKGFSHTYAQAGKYVVKLKNGTFDYNDGLRHPSFRENIYKIVSLHDKFPMATNTFRNSSKLVEANISNAVIIGEYQMCNNPNLTKVIANNVKAISIGYSFYNCSNLTEIIGLDTWNTDELTNMRYAFLGVPLTSLDDIAIADWNTENVIDMSAVFGNCNRLTFADLSGWDVGNVTNMAEMFKGCTSLTSINTEGWDTSKVENMREVFCNCSSLASLDLSGWDVGEVTDMASIFNGCTSLTSINMEGWDTGNVTNIDKVFCNCSSLTSLDLSGWNVGEVTTMYAMFQYCTSLTSVNVEGWNVSKVASMRSMFQYCTSLTSLDLSSWNTESLTDMAYAFSRSPSLQNLDLSDFNTGKVDNLAGAFEDCNLLTDFSFLNSWDIGKVTNIECMLQNTGLAGAFTLNWDLSNVIRMRNFLNGTKITDLNLRLTSNQTNITFDGFVNSLNLANWDGVDISIINKKSGWIYLFPYFRPENLVNNGNVNIKFYGTITRDMDIWGFLVYQDDERLGILRALSVNSIVNLLELLEDYTGQDTATLNLGSYTIARLSAEQIRIATDKNWTLV